MDDTLASFAAVVSKIIIYTHYLLPLSFIVETLPLALTFAGLNGLPNGMNQNFISKESVSLDSVSL